MNILFVLRQRLTVLSQSWNALSVVSQYQSRQENINEQIRKVMVMGRDGMCAKEKTKKNEVLQREVKWKEQRRAFTTD